MKLSSKIFIDGGIPDETKQANELLLKKLKAPLDGQTTNPTLIAKNLLAQNANVQSSNAKLTEEQALGEYKRIVQEMSRTIPHGSVSIQVFANEETKADEMLAQARERYTWIPNASIKFPCTMEGLKAAEIACKETPVNITLVFSQSQAAAVYEATKGAKFPVFLSPFVGRLDDRGENGMQLIENIMKLYSQGDGHVEVLTASTRTVDHILYALQLKSNIITIPFKVFKPWADAGFLQPDPTYVYEKPGANPILYRDDVVLGKPWQQYDLSHELTAKGINAFWKDWNSLFDH